MLEKLKEATIHKTEAEVLAYIADVFSGQAVFTTSFGVEDQVITDMICRYNIPIQIVAIDTGRLFEETYKVQDAVRKKYKKDIKVYAPDTKDLEALLAQKGPYSFYESIENRKECCYIRKVAPLSRALSGKACWVTGIRSEQSAGRSGMEKIQYDESYKMYKVNPLYDWQMADVMHYLETNEVPYNSLHHKGYVSIGCAPCTRAVKPGEDFRAGRWWWENNTGKECGLHESRKK